MPRLAARIARDVAAFTMSKNVARALRVACSMRLVTAKCNRERAYFGVRTITKCYQMLGPPYDDRMV